MRIWELCHGRDGWRLHVLEAASWRVAVEKVLVPAVNVATGHLFCCNIPERAFTIPLGRPHWVDEYLTNSLGGKMFDLGQWINQQGTFGRAITEAWVPIDPDTALKLDPDFFAEITAMLGDDDTSEDSR